MMLVKRPEVTSPTKTPAATIRTQTPAKRNIRVRTPLEGMPPLKKQRFSVNAVVLFHQLSDPDDHAREAFEKWLGTATWGQPIRCAIGCPRGRKWFEGLLNTNKDLTREHMDELCALLQRHLDKVMDCEFAVMFEYANEWQAVYSLWEPYVKGHKPARGCPIEETRKFYIPAEVGGKTNPKRWVFVFIDLDAMIFSVYDPMPAEVGTSPHHLYWNLKKILLWLPKMLMTLKMEKDLIVLTHNNYPVGRPIWSKPADSGVLVIRVMEFLIDLIEPERITEKVIDTMADRRLAYAVKLWSLN